MGSGREIAAPRASERCENGSNLLTVIQSIFQRHKRLLSRIKIMLFAIIHASLYDA